jgi:hypothetical protein
MGEVGARESKLTGIGLLFFFPIPRSQNLILS